MRDEVREIAENLRRTVLRSLPTSAEVAAAIVQLVREGYDVHLDVHVTVSERNRQSHKSKQIPLAPADEAFLRSVKIDPA